MTVSSIKVRVIRKPQIKVKVLTRFPADVKVAEFLTVDRDGAAYTFGVDYTKVNEIPINGTATAKFIVYDESAGIYKLLGLGSFLTGLTGDVTVTSDGTTAIGSGKVTSDMLNADVFSTAHSWSGQQTFTAPVLGTPASGTLTNATGLPISTGVSGLATGIASFLATPSSANLRAALTDEVGTGAAYFVGGALGTPASGTATNLTGLPVSTGISGLGTGVASFLATPSSANLKAALTDETGSGAAVFGTSPNITTPTGIVKGDVGLGSVDNTSDATKWAASATLTNKTFDTAGTGNVLKINGTAVSDKTGTGKVVLDTSPSIASPALTGTPTAPTASPSDNSTKVATTAYVDAQVASGTAGVASLNGKTGALTLNYQICGRLTLTSGTPVTTADVSGASSVYWTPTAGGMGRTNVYDGSNDAEFAFTELTLTLNNPAHVSGKIYDVFEFSDSGTLNVGTGPDWTAGTSGTSTARGTGSGSTELEFFHGRWVNKNSITLRNGSSTFSVAARQANAVGSIEMTATAQTEDSAVKRLVSNIYNQVPRFMRRADPTASWTYSTSSFRQANANTANQCSALLSMSGKHCHFTNTGGITNSTTTARNCIVGIGVNSTSTNSATTSSFAGVTTTFVASQSFYDGCPGIGHYDFTMLEYGGGTDTQTWRGTPATPVYVCGMSGWVMS